jgi:hypothetical protein
MSLTEAENKSVEAAELRDRIVRLQMLAFDRPCLSEVLAQKILSELVGDWLIVTGRHATVLCVVPTRLKSHTNLGANWQILCHGQSTWHASFSYSSLSRKHQSEHGPGVSLH